MLAGLLAAVAVMVGCSSEDGPVPTLAIRAEQADAPPQQQTGPTSAQGHPKETWDAVYLGGLKVGHCRTAQSELVEKGVKLVRIESTNVVRVNRSGQPSEHTILATAIETPAGQLVRFDTRLQSGATPTDFQGYVDGNELVVETQTAGKVATVRLPWPASGGGFMAMEESLLRQPMRPGERRAVTGLLAVINQPVTMDLIAERIEPTKLLGHSEDLLRVECRAKLPDGKPIVERLWVNRDGVILKRQIDALQQEIFRTTREIARAEVGPGKFDLMRDTTVRVNRPLPEVTRRVRYRVALLSNDPAQVFAQGITQQVSSLDPRTAEVTVSAVRPASEPRFFVADISEPAPEGIEPGGGKAYQGNAPSDDDRAPNNLIQSDNPKIVSMARSIAADESDPWRIATHLEQAVKRHIRRADYSQAFASAADVVEHAEGDCTEHAVLLAALCRARGIPARVAIGLVYVSAAQGFGYHMWNEAWIEGRWIPLDATLAQGGIGASHLKLADSNLRGTTAFSTFLSVAQVIGQLKIEVLEVE
jgi:hypothetical protein